MPVLLRNHCHINLTIILIQVAMLNLDVISLCAKKSAHKDREMHDDFSNVSEINNNFYRVFLLLNIQR